MISDADHPPARCEWLWRQRWLSRWLSPYRAVQPVRTPRPSRCRTLLQAGCALIILVLGLSFLGSGARAPHKYQETTHLTDATGPSIWPSVGPSIEPCATELDPTQGAREHSTHEASSMPPVLSSPPKHNSMVLFLTDDLEFSGGFDLNAPTPMARTREWLAAQGATASNFFAHCELDLA